jgi:gliding motility-associated-like protein
MMVKRFLLLLVHLLIIGMVSAQLCNGSLGDPVVNITFGSGPNPGPPLPAATTNYQYVTDPCPVNGYYTVLHSGIDCHYAWHVLQKDHTGDTNGYFMLVDASYEPSDFYLDTVKGLCANTTYEFAAWMLNMKDIQQGIRPNITFSIETITGQVLQTYNSGDVPPEEVATWRQYGFYFTTTSTDIVLRMRNNAAGGDGNDLALDDITFRPCGPKVSININGILNKKTVCTGDTASFIFSSSIVGSYTNPFFQWQKSMDGISWTDIAGANSVAYTNPAIVAPGNYFFRLSVAQGNNISIPSCRIASEPFVVTVEKLPVPQATNTGPACEGKSITLSANDGTVYLWTGPNNFTSNIQSPVITNTSFTNNGKYRVKVTSANGCSGTDSTMVVINQNPAVNAGIDVNICSGTSTLLQGSSANATSWSWSPIEGLSDPASFTSLASPDKTTWYTLTVNNGTCSNTDSVLVNVVAQPTANAGPDKVIAGNQFVTLDGQATGANISYYWTPNLFLVPDTILNPQVSPPYDNVYTLHVISNDGCGEATDNVLVKYYKAIYIPNAFTPNNDRLNDSWNIPALVAFPLSEVKVYNRYGQLIFYNKGYTKQWDGRFKGLMQLTGGYPYTINLKNGFKLLSGIVILIR